MQNDGTSDHRQQQQRGVFDVDEDRALDALALAWADFYDDIGLGHDGLWYAHHMDAPDGEVVTGVTPDELNRAIRADCARRAAP